MLINVTLKCGSYYQSEFVLVSTHLNLLQLCYNFVCQNVAPILISEVHVGSCVGDRYREVGRTGGGCGGSQEGGRSHRELADVAQNWFDLLGV